MARKVSSLLFWSGAAVIAGTVVVVQGFCGAPLVRVYNEGGMTMTALRFEGAEAAVPDRIPPQTTADVILEVSGEAAPRLRWSDESGGSLADVGYVERFGGYCVEVHYRSNGRVDVAHGVMNCFSWRRLL